MQLTCRALWRRLTQTQARRTCVCRLLSSVLPGWLRHLLASCLGLGCVACLRLVSIRRLLGLGGIPCLRRISLHIKPAQFRTVPSFPAALPQLRPGFRQHVTRLTCCCGG